MRLEQCPLPGGGSLTVYLRDAAQAMPNALRRPVVVVVPGGGYNHVSAREACPVRPICLRKGGTAPASARLRWMLPARTGITGWSWRWNGWEKPLISI